MKIIASRALKIPTILSRYVARNKRRKNALALAYMFLISKCKQNAVNQIRTLNVKRIYLISAAAMKTNPLGVNAPLCVLKRVYNFILLHISPLVKIPGKE